MSSQEYEESPHSHVTQFWSSWVMGKTQMVVCHQKLFFLICQLTSLSDLSSHLYKATKWKPLTWLQKDYPVFRSVLKTSIWECPPGGGWRAGECCTCLLWGCIGGLMKGPGDSPAALPESCRPTAHGSAGLEDGFLQTPEFVTLGRLSPVFPALVR